MQADKSGWNLLYDWKKLLVWGKKYLPERNNKCIFVRKVCLFLYWIESFVLISILSGMQLYVNNYPHEQIDF